MRALLEPFTIQPSHQILLNALEGVCYICGFDGEILAVGEDNWAEFAVANAAQEGPQASGLIGTNLFQYISGEEVIASYESCFDAIRSGRSRTVSFTYRCDAPDIRREMRMCLSGISVDAVPRAVLMQSLTLDERERPPVSLFDIANARASEATLPLVTLCSYCHDVKQGDAWVTAEHYYAHGGAERMRVSHGICPQCHGTKIPAWDAA